MYVFIESVIGLFTIISLMLGLKLNNTFLVIIASILLLVDIILGLIAAEKFKD